jgi:hypothetical protein
MTSRPQLAEAETVLRRFFALPPRQQLEHYQVVHEYLVAAEGIPGGIPPEITERIEALKVMKQVADHLGLSEGKSPPSTDFNKHLKHLGIKDWSLKRVSNAFRGTYPGARDEYEGRKPPPTVEQEAIRRAAAGRERGWETPLEALRQFVLWLDQQPDEVREDKSGPGTYGQWADGHNRQVRKEGGYYYPKAGSIRAVLKLTWSLALAVARGQMPLDEARQRQREARRQEEGPLHLIGLTEVADILSLHHDEVMRLREIGELPAAATISGQAVWFRDDIELRARRQAVPQRTPGWMQSEVVDVPEAAQRLKLKVASLISTLYRQKWHRVPDHDGKVADKLYWVRGPFEAWLQEHDYE